MKKATFIKIVKAIQKQYTKENKLADFWYDTLGEYFPMITGEMFNEVVDAIDEEFGGDMLSWWLWDAPYGIEREPVKDGVLQDEDGNDIDVSTVDKLYDYMVSQKETEK